MRSSFLVLAPAMLFLALSMGASNCARNQVKADSLMSALEAGDQTGPIQGCGAQLVAGLTRCKKQEGDATTEPLIFVAPPAKCLGDGPCASFKIYLPNGQPPYGDMIPQGQTSRSVPWKTITGLDQFSFGQRGFWPYDYDIDWIGDDGRPGHTHMEGDIVLRIYPRGYTPLDGSPNDPNFVWSWIQDGTPIKMTTGGRVWVGQKP